MVLRNPGLGMKLIILNKDGLHVYNPEAKDHITKKNTKSKNLLLTSPSFFFANAGTTLHIYDVKSRDLAPSICVMQYEPEVF